MNWHLKNKKSILSGMLFFVFFSCSMFAMRRIGSLQEEKRALCPPFLYDESNSHIDVVYAQDYNQSMNVTMKWYDAHDVRHIQDGLLTDDKNKITQNRQASVLNRIKYFYDEIDNEYYFLPTSGELVFDSKVHDYQDASDTSDEECLLPLPPLLPQDEAFAQSRRDDEFDFLNQSEVFQFPPAADEQKESPCESHSHLENDEEYSWDIETQEYDEYKTKFICVRKKRKKL